MTKIGRLLAKYYRANVDRHNLYCYRSRKGSLWTEQDQAKLNAAKLKKKEVSKELRTYLKKSGMRVVWGDRNQIVSIITDCKYQLDKRNQRKLNEYYAKQHLVNTMDKLDLV